MDNQKNKQSRETGNIGNTRHRGNLQHWEHKTQGKLATLGTQDTRRRQIKQNTHHYAQTNTNNVNKTKALLQTIGGKDKPNIVSMRKS